MTTPDELKGLVMPCYDAATKRDLTETELRIVWLVLRCSFGNGRQETGRLTLADLATCLGISKGKASEAMKKLRGKRMVQPSTSGDGWQFMPESNHECGHKWMVFDRLVDLSKRLLANRVEAAQRRVAGEMALPGMEEPDLAAMLGAGAVESAAGSLASQIGKNGFPNWEAGHPGNGEGVCGTGGGARFFLPAGVPESGTSRGESLLKSFPPTSIEPIKTHNTLNRGSVPDSGTVGRENGLPDGEAGMDKGDFQHEDAQSRDEKVLMRRLVELLGRDTMKGRTGASLRLFIRGSLDAGDSTATAEAMRKAINDTETAVREGTIKKSRLGYLRGWAFFYAGRLGWRFNAGSLSWEKCEPFSTWKQRQAMKRSVRA